MWITKKKLKQMLRDTEEELCQTKNKLEDAEGRADYYQRAYEATEYQVKDYHKALDEHVAKYNQKVDEFPFSVGSTCYQTLLRSANGRFTKKNASLSHSTVVPVVVDEKNYFKIRKALNSEYFLSENAATIHLAKTCTVE